MMIGTGRVSIKAVRYWSCPLSQSRDKIIPQKSCPWWNLNLQPQDYEAEAIPLEPQLLMIT